MCTTFIKKKRYFIIMKTMVKLTMFVLLPLDLMLLEVGQLLHVIGKVERESVPLKLRLMKCKRILLLVSMLFGDIAILLGGIGMMVLLCSFGDGQNDIENPSVMELSYLYAVGNCHIIGKDNDFQLITSSVTACILKFVRSENDGTWFLGKLTV